MNNTTIQCNKSPRLPLYAPPVLRRFPCRCTRQSRKWYRRPVSGGNGFVGFDLRHDLGTTRWAGGWNSGYRRHGGHDLGKCGGYATQVFSSLAIHRHAAPATNTPAVERSTHSHLHSQPRADYAADNRCTAYVNAAVISFASNSGVRPSARMLSSIPISVGRPGTSHSFQTSTVLGRRESCVSPEGRLP
jgi:hypothetical protein